MGVYSVVEEVQMHQKYIGKTKQNRWKTKRWWLLVRVAGCFSKHRVGLLGASPWAAGFSFPWGILGLFASFF